MSARSKSESRIGIARLREALAYDPRTGDITWRRTESARRVAGARVGTVSPRGYRRFVLDGVRLSANRVAWALFHGAWPDADMEVDHANGDRSDDRIKNLRLATPTQNRANSVSRGDLPKGVQRKFKSGTYSARIYRDGRHWYLGSFKTIDEAAHAYNKAAIEIHGEFARLNPVGGYYAAEPETDKEVRVDMELIEDRSIPVPEAGCWVWTGPLCGRGYGSIPLGKRGMREKAHRASWSLRNGPIPEGFAVHHTCDIRACVNPDHLIARPIAAQPGGSDNDR